MSNIGIAVWLGPAEALDEACLQAVAAIGFEAAVCAGPALAAPTLAASLHALRMNPAAVVLRPGDPAPDTAWQAADLLVAGGGASTARPVATAGRRVVLPEGQHLAEAVTDPEVLVALDVASVHTAGQDPAAWLRRLSGRCPYVILRVDAGGTGAGQAPVVGGFDAWADLFDAGEEAAVEWYVVVPPPEAGASLPTLAHTHAFLVREA